MNAVEHIVDAYFRVCLNCFTMGDVKIPGGNSRQFDILAVNLTDRTQYHIESSVAHVPRWCPHAAELERGFDRKFLGAPAMRDGPNGDRARGKTYKASIWAAYRSVGFDPDKVRRIWVTWMVKDPENLPAFLASYKSSKELDISVLSLRDEIIPKLQGAIATANYDDRGSQDSEPTKTDGQSSPTRARTGTLTRPVALVLAVENKRKERYELVILRN